MQKETMRKIGIVVLAVLLSSCHLFDEYDKAKGVAIYFQESNVSVFEGGLGALTLIIEPSTSLPYENVVYKTSDENIAKVFTADRRGVVFLGVGVGSAIMTAEIGGAVAKAVVNVLVE